MQPEVHIIRTDEMNIHASRAVLDENPKYLNKFLTFKNPDIQASYVSQFRLIPPPENSQSKNK